MEKHFLFTYASGFSVPVGFLMGIWHLSIAPTVPGNPVHISNDRAMSAISAHVAQVMNFGAQVTSTLQKSSKPSCTVDCATSNRSDIWRKLYVLVIIQRPSNTIVSTFNGKGPGLMTSVVNSINC